MTSKPPWKSGDDVACHAECLQTVMLNVCHAERPSC